MDYAPPALDGTSDLPTLSATWNYFHAKVIWLKDCDTHYEYVCVYVDDIMMMGKAPATFFKDVTERYKYNIKGVGKHNYHLGGDFSRDKDGTLT
jgi:hypothetical protein